MKPCVVNEIMIVANNPFLTKKRMITNLLFVFLRY